MEDQDFMEQAKPVFIAGYVRVSSLHQVKVGSSLAEQRATIETYAKAYGYEIYQIYADEGISGAISERPALIRMKEDGKKGLFRKVVFTCLDRFGRSASDTLAAYTHFEKLGIPLYSIKEGIDTSTSMGRLIRTVLAGIAEMERERMAERCTLGRLARLEKGFRINPGPFGYSWNERTGIYEINPKEAWIYRRVVDDYLVKGKSQREIARDLNRDGIKSKFGKKWSQKVISRMLYNPAYKGCSTFSLQGQKFEIKYPPLIMPGKWDEIQLKARENVDNVHRRFKKGTPFLLENLLKCGECRCGIYPYRQKNRVARYYVCHSADPRLLKKRPSTSARACHLGRIPANEIETQVLNELRAYFQLPKNLLRLRLQRIDPGKREELKKSLAGDRDRLQALECKKNMYRDLYSEEAIDKEELKKREDVLNSSIQYLREQIALRERAMAAIRLREVELNDVSNRAINPKEIRREISEVFSRMSGTELKDFLQAAFGERNLTVCSAFQMEGPRRIGLGRSNSLAVENADSGRERTWKLYGTRNMNLESAFQYLNLLMSARKVKGGSPLNI